MLIFALSFGTNYLRSQPMFDGVGGLGVDLHFVGDFPLSLACFSALWDGKWRVGLVMWGIGESMLWFFWGVIIQRVLRSAQK